MSIMTIVSGAHSKAYMHATYCKGLRKVKGCTIAHIALRKIPISKLWKVILLPPVNAPALPQAGKPVAWYSIYILLQGTHGPVRIEG